MDKIKELLSKYYSLQLVCIFIVTAIITLIFKIHILSGLVLIGLTIFAFVRSFKNNNFKSKHIALKVLIYFFMAVFVISGFMTLSNNNGDAMRQQLNYKN